MYGVPAGEVNLNLPGFTGAEVRQYFFQGRFYEVKTMKHLRVRIPAKIRVLCVVVCVGGLCRSASAAEGAVTPRATLGVGKVQLEYFPAEHRVAIRGKNIDLNRPGTAYVLSAEGAATELRPVRQTQTKVHTAKGEVVVAVLRLGDQPEPRGVFLLNPGPRRSVSVPLAAFGFGGNAVYAGYDLLTDEFFGPVTGSLARLLPANGWTLVALGRAGRKPALLATSQSLGAQPESLHLSWNAQTKTLRGECSLPTKSEYQVRLFAPPEPVRLVAVKATASGDRGGEIATRIMQTHQWLRLYLAAPEAQQVRWTITFEEQPAKALAPPSVKLSAKALSPRRVQLTCPTGGASLVVRRNDGAVLPLTSPWLTDTTVAPDTSYTYTAYPAGWTGKQQALATATVRTPALPPLPPRPDIYLSDIDPVSATNGWNGEPRRDKSIEDNPLSIRGEVFEKGMGVHAVSELIYAVKPYYKRFVAVVGVDDEKNDAPAGTVTFAVYADDKQLFKTGVLTPFDERVNVNVAIPDGAKQIRLVVGDGGNGNGCDHADWANAGFLTLGARIVEPPKPPKEVAEGFTALFNGKSLAGWHGDSRFWSVAGAVIRGDSTRTGMKSGQPALVWSAGRPENFVLKVRFRLRSGRAAVVYRGRSLGGWRVDGYRAVIDKAAGKTGSLADSSGRILAAPGGFVELGTNGKRTFGGRVTAPDDLGEAASSQPGGWNEYVLVVRGNHVLQELNGVQVAELIDHSRAPFPGVLALQLDGTVPTRVEFKDVWLKELNARFGKALRLFDGKTLTGWTVSSPKLKNTWSVKDGVLDDTGKPAGYLRTTADYTNYVLRVQLRHLTKGNSGVLVRMVGKDKVWPRSIECQGQFGNLGDIWNIDNFPMKVAAGRTQGRHTAKRHPPNEKPLGHWNQYEITLNGGDLEIKVNDLVQNTATECWETPGKICLQAEGAHIQFRNLVLIPILR